jgi:protein-L-isoaspartate(D-aspartate) O-methyltransferase
MTDMSKARHFMVECQVRPSDVTDTRITDLMSGLERERFVPAARQALAYSDACIEVKPGRFLMDPRSLAKLVQALDVREGDRVLDIGCATGYSSALLAGLSADVTALEEDEELAKAASSALRSVHKLGRLSGAVGPLKQGASQHAPYDVIFVNGAVEEIPQAWVEQLKDGGRLGVIVNGGPNGKANFCVRKSGTLGKRVVFDATVPVLPGFERTRSFVFQ